jgi:hypothetical protein
MLFKKRPSWISQHLWLRMMRKRDSNKRWRRQIIRFFKSPKLAFSYARYRKAIEAANWPEVKNRTLELRGLAVRTGDIRTIEELVLALERVGCYEESAQLWLTELSERTRISAKEWRGENLEGKTALLDFNQSSHGLGVGYRCAHIVPEIASLAQRTILVLEPRQVPTFKRSFPNLEIVTSRGAIPDREIDYVITHTYLITVFDLKRVSALPNFQPLKTDPIKTASLRKKYLEQSGGRKPLIGLSWYSSHHGKDLPPLADWRDFLARTDATFISLQYGNISQELQALGRDKVIFDETIDQLKDMDSFAAQVAALDGLITVISTLTNVGGALNVPTVVLRDDWFRRNLPVLGDRVPWFPNMRVAGKDGRAWPPVLNESFSKLQTLIVERSSAPDFRPRSGN